jgi:hypothetical protein
MDIIFPWELDDDEREQSRVQPVDDEATAAESVDLGAVADSLAAGVDASPAEVAGGIEALAAAADTTPAGVLRAVGLEDALEPAAPSPAGLFSAMRAAGGAGDDTADGAREPDPDADSTTDADATE